MKKLFLLIALFISFASKAEIPLYDVYFNDTLHIESHTSTSLNLENVFKEKAYDKTSDNIYFYLSKTEYIIYIPDAKIKFIVTSNNFGVEYHFLYLMQEIQKNRSKLIKECENIYFYSYY